MITAQQLAEAMQCPLARANKWVKYINLTMDKYAINTPLRIAHFLSQVGHESGRLIYVKELASGKAYDYRADLGNTKPEAIAIAKANNSTAGAFWKGHGLIQTTGYNNHLWMSKALGIDCVNHPELLTENETEIFVPTSPASGVPVKLMVLPVMAMVIHAGFETTVNAKGASPASVMEYTYGLSLYASGKE